VSYASEVIADGPVAYWRCGDVSGPLVDATGNRNATDNSLTFGITGIPGGGGDTAITCPSGSAFADFTSIPAAWNLGDTFSLECWIKLASGGVAQTMIYGGAGCYVLGIDSANNVSLFRTQGSEYIIHKLITVDASWHHVVATKTGATAKLYIDGADVGVPDSNFTIGNPASNMSLFNTGGIYIHGSMDEIAIYPTVLSAARVLVHYTVGSTDPAAVFNLAPVIYGRGAA
jgi:hypothetical protein